MFLAQCKDSMIKSLSALWPLSCCPIMQLTWPIRIEMSACTTSPTLQSGDQAAKWPMLYENMQGKREAESLLLLSHSSIVALMDHSQWNSRMWFKDNWFTWASCLWRESCHVPWALIIEFTRCADTLRTSCDNVWLSWEDVLVREWNLVLLDNPLLVWCYQDQDLQCSSIATTAEQWSRIRSNLVNSEFPSSSV